MGVASIESVYPWVREGGRGKSVNNSTQKFSFKDNCGCKPKTKVGKVLTYKSELRIIHIFASFFSSFKVFGLIARGVNGDS